MQNDEVLDGLLSNQKLNNFFESLISTEEKARLNQIAQDAVGGYSDPLYFQKEALAQEIIANHSDKTQDLDDTKVLDLMQSFLLTKKDALSPEVFKQASNDIMCEPGQILKHQDLNNFVESLVEKDNRFKNLIEKELASILKENKDLIDFSSSEKSISIGSISQAALMIKFLEKLEQQLDSSILKTIIKSDKISEGEDFILSVLNRNIKKASSKNNSTLDKEELNFTTLVSTLNTELNPISTLKPGALLPKTKDNQPSRIRPPSLIQTIVLGGVLGGVLASAPRASAAPPIIRGNGLAPSFPLKTPLFSPENQIRGQADDDCDPNVKSAQQNCLDPNSPSPPPPAPPPPPPAPPPPAPPPPAPPPPPSSTTTVAAPPPPPAPSTASPGASSPSPAPTPVASPAPPPPAPPPPAPTPVASPASPAPTPVASPASPAPTPVASPAAPSPTKASTAAAAQSPSLPSSNTTAYVESSAYFNSLVATLALEGGASSSLTEAKATAAATEAETSLSLLNNTHVESSAHSNREVTLAFGEGASSLTEAATEAATGSAMPVVLVLASSSSTLAATAAATAAATLAFGGGASSSLTEAATTAATLAFGGGASSSLTEAATTAAATVAASTPETKISKSSAEKSDLTLPLGLGIGIPIAAATLCAIYYQRKYIAKKQQLPTPPPGAVSGAISTNTATLSFTK